MPAGPAGRRHLRHDARGDVGAQKEMMARLAERLAALRAPAANLRARCAGTFHAPSPHQPPTLRCFRPCAPAPSLRRHDAHAAAAAAPRPRAAAAASGAAAASPAAAASILGGGGLIRLAPGEVHVWWLRAGAAAADAALLRRCAALLPADELAECSPPGGGGGVPAPGGALAQRLLARAAARCVLARYAPGGAPPGALRIARGPHGKPGLSPPLAGAAGASLAFNLTHTAGLVGVAVAAGGAVGLDAERDARRTRGDPAALAARRFSAAEAAALAAAPPGARAAAFVRLWTLKEAYVKALGRGISAAPGLSSFSFDVRERGGAGGGAREAAAIEFSSAAPEPRRWRFLLLRPAEGLTAALAAEVPPGAGAAAPPGASVRAFEAAIDAAEREMPLGVAAWGEHVPGGGAGTAARAAL